MKEKGALTFKQSAPEDIAMAGRPGFEPGLTESETKKGKKVKANDFRY